MAMFLILILTGKFAPVDQGLYTNRRSVQTVNSAIQSVLHPLQHLAQLMFGQQHQASSNCLNDAV